MSASTHSSVLKHHFDNLEQQHASERLGIWMFLATEVLFFGGLFGAYTVYRLYYPNEFEFASSKLNRTIATVNTLFLITSSLTITLGIRAPSSASGGAHPLSLYRGLGTGSWDDLARFRARRDFHEHILLGAAFGGHQGGASERG